MFANVHIMKNGISCNDVFDVLVRGDKLSMKYISGSLLNNFLIPVTEMKDLVLDHWQGSKQLDFSYKDLDFEFIENGFGDITYLQSNLFQKT